jgi:PAS domain S-box-containing protein
MTFPSPALLVPDFRALFESAPGIFLALTPDLRIVAVSDAQLKATMRKREEILGRDLFDAFPDNPNDPTATGVADLRASFARVFQNKAPDTMAVLKYDIRRPETVGGGFEERYWSTVNSPVFGPNNDIAYIIIHAQDVTDQSRLTQAGTAQRQALGESEERYRLLVEGVKDYAIFMLDKEGCVLTWNEGAQRIKGYTSEEIIGQPIERFYPPEDKALGKPAAMLRTAEEQGRVENEGWRIRKDGSRFWADVVITAVRDSEKRLLGFSEVSRDLTERKQAEEERERYVKELALSNTELQQFAYVASHDLQEPLRMITSYTQLLSKRYKGQMDADADEFIAYAVDGASRMQKLIEDLLTYSRLGTNKVPFVQVDSNVVLQRAIDNLSVTVQETDATVTSDPLPVVFAVESQLLQLFQNLAGNAIKYHGPNPPQIHVAAHEKDSEWVFSVRDNGIGIEPQYADRIFVIFQRLHTSEKYPGTGIGLAVCKKIVERHGGRIWVESQTGQGATFYFTIPINGGNKIGNPERF